MYSEILPDITKDYILSRVSQEQIMEYYLQLPVKLGVKYKSPLRVDRHPTANYFYSHSGDLLFKDHNGSFIGDCFKVVMQMYSKNYPQALELIARDFNLANIPIGEAVRPTRPPEAFTPKKAKIVVHYRPWEQWQLNYWAQFGISPSTLDFFQVGVVDTAWINEVCVYSYKKSDPCFGYYFSGDDYKLYFPYRSKDEVRFMGNSQKIQGYYQLPREGKLLLLTKSQKDIMTLYELGVTSISLQAESIFPPLELISELRTRFKHLYTLYDFDLAGIRTANKIYRTYGINRIFLTNGRFGTKNQQAKDASEYVQKYGMPSVQEFVNQLKTQHSLW